MQVQVARIGKPHGIRGEVTVQLFTDAPEERFAPGAVLDIENFNPASPAGTIAPAGTLTVKKSRWNKKILVVAFEEVTNRNQAEELRDTRLTFDSSAETDADSDDEGYYEHELLDLPVYLAADVKDGYLPEEPIAVVTGLQTMPTQDLLILENTADGEEVMIPFVEELIPAIDTEEGYIIINPPAGLLELNSDDEEAEAETESEHN
ncbi:ribosome maturation factor RimM [Rothia nasimurium]|uniref:Ribosome maturation factor RimM n=1 Tax=Rothia nasimurium TaxID=85336 RepID=A0A4Y9F7W9_9MICC|nr:ribosome maturation factor RimM [Rothia nasimurium]MBF0807157.1 ribosome maturation factor RimM [Rothia nasimurium]TFU24141.1 ribosome maturation factor RimM [Rothia nasimurium]